jgi:hypothetical protein
VVLSGLQDQLAPLKSWLFPRRVYLQLEDQAFTAMVLDGERVAWLERVPLPEGLCVNGQPTAVEALGDLVGDLLIERGFPGARVKAVLPRAATAWRVIAWPDARWPDQPEVVVRQQQDQLDLPWSLQDADLRLEPLIGAPPRSLLVAVQRGLLEAWIEVFSQAGVALDGMEPLPICLWRAAEPQLGEGVQVLLQLEQEQSWLLALDQGEPLGEWPLPAATEQEALIPALNTFQRRFHPRAALVSGEEQAVDAVLSELEGALRCSVAWLEPRDQAPALRGLMAGDRLR